MDDWKNTQYPNRDYGVGAPPPTSSEGEDWKVLGGIGALLLGAVVTVGLLIAGLFL